MDQHNRVWVGDVTFIATRKGWLFLAVMIDLFSRKVIGWAVSQKNNRELTRDCLLRLAPQGLAFLLCGGWAIASHAEVVLLSRRSETDKQ